jgi:Ca-activated chloride channel homolog
MEWQHPQWLYLILPLAASWLALALYSRGLRRRAAEAFVAQEMWSRILPPDSRARFWLKLLWREIAIVMGLVALAGPQFGTQYEDVIPKGSDLYVLIDVSRSMLAEDVLPSRLGRAKADVAALVNRLEGERVGLIAFAGQAVVKCPLTADYDTFRRSLDELDPGSAPRGGTAIGDAIRKALEVFHARSERDQAILLITDGDDQQSYPLEAAAVAAERHVTIFTVGLGDADHGARIPRTGQARSFVEYQGQQVWTKLDGSLLKEIALKTSGVYVPVGTKAYDLGELYAKYLQGRRGGEEQSGKRIRRADQFQIFLALALLALLADIFTRPYAAIIKSADLESESRAGSRGSRRARAAHPGVPVSAALLLVAFLAGVSRADNPAEVVRDGLRWYEKGNFDKAREKFASAREQFDSADAAKAAIAAFDQACAAHRKGDVAQAREWYLKAGLARDKSMAAAAHFNLGTLAAEEARRLAGEQPESVAPEKRPEILDQLKTAVVSFRHCLELQPDNARARRDIELVRQWIKYHVDRWAAHDREKRRQETNLIAFVEFLIETQRALRESVKALPETAPSDTFADPKRLQDELQEEIAPLKEKIKAELSPKQAGGGSAPQSNATELEQGIALLQSWAGAAGDKMASASRHLDERQAAAAAADQQAAIDELEKIWDAVIPFYPLLARDLADQTKIVQALTPPSSPDSQKEAGGPAPKKDANRDSKAAESATKDRSAGAGQSNPGIATEDLAPITEAQERTLHRTQMLKLKAEAELERLEKAPPVADQTGKGSPAGKDASKNASASGPKPPDPKEIKAGYQKAIELAPRGVEKMERALKSLKQKNSPAAFPPAEEARKILEEIQKAQPKQDQDDKKQQDQDKKKEDQQKQDQNKQNEDQKKQDQKDQQKKDQQKNDEEKKDQEKKDQEQQKKDEESKKSDEQKKSGGQNKSDEQKQQQQQPQISRDQIEDALRKVRERQQEKRERDRKMKARVLGSVPVEKDW